MCTWSVRVDPFDDCACSTCCPQAGRFLEGPPSARRQAIRRTLLPVPGAEQLVARSAFNTASNGTVVGWWRDIWVGASVVDHHALARLQGSSPGPALRLVRKIKECCVGRNPAGHRTTEDHGHQYQDPHVFAPELTRRRPSGGHGLGLQRAFGGVASVTSVRNCAADRIAAARPPRHSLATS
jgi:hypothetical protein